MNKTLEYPLEEFDWNKKRLQLSVSSELFCGRFPMKVAIRSHHTGNVMFFVPVQPNHPLFDPDHGDGEQRIYVPEFDCTKTQVESLCVYHTY